MSKNKWVIDPTHSQIQFKVKHLMISTVTGYFKEFNLEATTENDDFTTMRDVIFTIDTDSVDTNNEPRDTHLKSADFFNSEAFKTIAFTGTSYTGSGNAGKLSGNLSIRGIVKPVLVNIEFGGIVVDSYGQTKAGFTVEGKINRTEFGLTWGALTEAGNIVVADDVKFHGEIQLIKNTEQ
ncbi:MAG: polyisoprenoid-binding protein [Ferruginibacter sp.]|nr:polyisoprenoid-binding protein [Ferruginibacter sp.]